MIDRDAMLARLRVLLQDAAADAGLLQQMRDAVAAALLRAGTEPASPASPAVAWQGIVGDSPPMMQVRAQIEKFAPTTAPVLVHGESGTGKELVAAALHQLSPRRNEAFVSENCAAIPETLLESVLFGHARGAFTGAVKDHPGHFVAAHRGTLFLDEIGDMPLSMQAKLLRALQEGEVRPVGGTKTRRVDVRVIGATNQDLAQLVREGRFREDLYYRLNVLQIELPPLRERGLDVLLLARQFLARAAERAQRRLELAPAAEAVLLRARWPGNVRQLQNEMQRVAALAEGPVVGASDLSPDLVLGAAS